MNEQTQTETQKSKRKKHVILLAVGVATTVIAKCFGIRNPNAYTSSALAFIVLSQPIAYFVVLGLVAIVVSAIKRNVKQYWFPILAWLFLVAGLFDIVVGGFNEFVLRPKINQGIEELVRSGKIEVPEFDPRERLLGHWSSEDDLTHQYFGPNNHLIIVNLGQQKDVKYSVEDFSVIERWIKFNVSGADYDPHTRTMYFLGDGSAWQIMESSFGKFKSKLKHVGTEQFP